MLHKKQYEHTVMDTCAKFILWHTCYF